MNSLSNLIKRETEEQDLECNPPYASSQQQIIELIDLYWMDRYRDGETDSLGVKKPFFNVIEYPVAVSAKMIDFDTKDIKIIPENNQSRYACWFFERELKMYIKDKKNKYGETFGQFLNSLTYTFPKYGHVLIKKTGDTVSLVPLQNVFVKSDAKKFLNSPYLNEKHEYTPTELEQIAKKNNWDNLYQVLDKIAKDRKQEEMEKPITIWERYGFYEGSDYNWFIVPEGLDDDYVMAYAKRDPNDYYKEAKWDDVPGRAMGRGVVEKLFEAQIHTNKVANYKSHGLHWTSKHIYQTRDTGINRNLMTGVEDGDILRVNSELMPVQNEERNLSAYQEEEFRWDGLIDKRTFAQDILRGQRSPAGTPLGSDILRTQQATGFFDLKREDLGMLIKDILWDWIIPSFRKTKKEAHEFLLKGDPNDDMFKNIEGMFVANETNKLSFARNMPIVSPKERELLSGLAKEKVKQSSVKIPEGLYEDIKYKIKIVLEGEDIDLDSKIKMAQYILQTVASNPTILQDPNAKKVFYMLLDMIGFSELNFENEQPGLAEMLGQQRGGSMARIPNATPGQPQTARVNTAQTL